jgi:hypothetical protein
MMLYHPCPCAASVCLWGRSRNILESYSILHKKINESYLYVFVWVVISGYVCVCVRICVCACVHVHVSPD